MQAILLLLLAVLCLLRLMGFLLLLVFLPLLALLFLLLAAATYSCRCRQFSCCSNCLLGINGLSWCRLFCFC